MNGCVTELFDSGREGCRQQRKQNDCEGNDGLNCNARGKSCKEPPKHLSVFITIVLTKSLNELLIELLKKIFAHT